MARRSIREHNEAVLNELEIGDIVKFDRGPYNHKAIYKGDGKVIHMGKDSSCKFGWSDMPEIRTDDFFVVAGRSKAYKDNKTDEHYKPRSNRSIKRYAEEQLEERDNDYNLLTNNCSHFANYCRYGKKESKQVKWICQLAKILTYLNLAAGLAPAVAVAANHK